MENYGSRDSGQPSIDQISERVSGDVSVDLLLGIPLSLSIEVGRTRLPLSEVLDLGEDSVIELERLVGEPLDVLINGILVAQGIIVMVDQKFGIQITDIVSPRERVESFRQGAGAA